MPHTTTKKGTINSTSLNLFCRRAPELEKQERRKLKGSRAQSILHVQENHYDRTFSNATPLTATYQIADQFEKLVSLTAKITVTSDHLRIGSIW